MQKRRMIAALLSIGLAGLGCNSSYAGDKQKDEQDVKIHMDQVPAAVKATLEKEANGGRLGDIDKELKKGKAIYSANATVGGKAYEIKVAEDGALVSKKLDDDKEDHEGKNDKDEKGDR